MYRTTNPRRESQSKSKRMRLPQLCKRNIDEESIDTLYKINNNKKKTLRTNVNGARNMIYLCIYTNLGFADDDVAEYRNDDQDAN